MNPRRVLRFIVRSGKRLIVSLVGAALVLAGLMMLVLPGPGLLVIIAGLAVLATEYAWARRVLETARGKAREAAQRVRRKPRPPQAPPAA